MLAAYPLKAVADVPSEFVILAKGKAFIRERKFLDSLDGRISDLVLQLGNQQLFFNQLDLTTLQKIKAIMLKYDLSA